MRIVELDIGLQAGGPVPDWCVPVFADGQGEVGIAFSAFAIASGGRRIVVDPWLANDGPRDRDGASATAQRLLTCLADAGLTPDEVDVVVTPTLALPPVPIGWQEAVEGPIEQLLRNTEFTPFTAIANATPGRPGASTLRSKPPARPSAAPCSGCAMRSPAS